MDVTEIQDWQFGQLGSDARWSWCASGVEWTTGLRIDVCIKTKLTENNTIPEHARAIFNALRDRQNEFISAAARKLLDAFNAFWDDDDDRPAEWPFDVSGFLDQTRLMAVIVDPDQDSELQCHMDGGPMLRVFVSPDLSFKTAWFD